MRDAFTCGPAVYGTDFFGRLALINSLLESMLAGRESTLLIGESRIGKTSILRQLAHALAPDSGTAVFFDGYAGSADRFAEHLGTALEAVPSLQHRAETAGQGGLYPLLRLLESSRERLTLLVDEVDGIVADEESARFIRSAASIGHKIVIATSRLDPSEHETTPNEPVWWNVFRIQYVGLFDEHEANDLLLTLSERSGARFTDGECGFFRDLMGGFPFFLQWLGHEVFERGFRDCTTSQRRELLEELATDYTLLGMLGDHFTGWLERLDEQQRHLLVESASGRGITPTPVMVTLKNRGLVVAAEDGRWRPFSGLFREFLRCLPKAPLLTDDLKGKLWQGLVPAIKTVVEVAAKHYL